MKKLLFICSLGSFRSRIAADFFSQFKEYETRYGGVDGGAHQRLTSENIKWADHIIFMEQMHYFEALVKFRNAVEKKSIVNGIWEAHMWAERVPL